MDSVVIQSKKRLQHSRPLKLHVWYCLWNVLHLEMVDARLGYMLWREHWSTGTQTVRMTTRFDWCDERTSRNLIFLSLRRIILSTVYVSLMLRAEMSNKIIFCWFFCFFLNITVVCLLFLPPVHPSHPRLRCHRGQPSPWLLCQVENAKMLVVS